MTGWLTAAAMAPVLTALIVVMLGYRSRALKWYARSQHWFDVAREVERKNAGLVADERRLAVMVEHARVENNLLRDELRALRRATTVPVSLTPEEADHAMRVIFPERESRKVQS